MASTCEPREDCKIFYTCGDCQSTYADALGGKYDAFQAVWVIAVFLLWLPTLDFSWRIFSRRKVFPIDTQKKVFLVCLSTTFLFTIRAISPFGWRAELLDPVTVGLSYDWVTTLLLTLIALLVHDWCQLTLRISGRRDLSRIINGLFVGFYVLLWISWTVLSVLQNSEGRFWLFRGIKLASGAFFLLCLFLLQTYFGLLIYKVLHENEKARAVATSSPSADSVPDSARPTSRWGRAKKKLSTRKRSKITKILKLLVIVSIVEALAMGSMVATAVGEFQGTRHTLDDFGPPPEGFGDIIAEAIFDFLQFFSITVAIYFFRPQRPDGHEADSQAGESSRSGGRSTRGNEKSTTANAATSVGSGDQSDNEESQV